MKCMWTFGHFKDQNENNSHKQYNCKITKLGKRNIFQINCFQYIKHMKLIKTAGVCLVNFWLKYVYSSFSEVSHIGQIIQKLYSIKSSDTSL